MPPALLDLAPLPALDDLALPALDDFALLALEVSVLVVGRNVVIIGSLVCDDLCANKMERVCFKILNHER